MISTSFRYETPTSGQEAAELMNDGAQLMGGGTWVVPSLNNGGHQPKTIIDLRRAGLNGIDLDGDTVRIGATSTYSDVMTSQLVETELPLLKSMALGVTGGRQILNQGTIGGSVVAARPSSDAPAVVVALGARVVVLGPDGGRVIDADTFFVGPEQTALGSNEVVVALEFTSARGLHVGYSKLKHGASSWPIITAAAVLRGANGTGWSAATVILGGVAGIPLSVDLGDCSVDGQLDEERMRMAIADHVNRLETPWSDVIASAEYRRAVAPAVGLRAVRMAASDTAGGLA
jgi:CO/xanthine dehydrogenase FAD-binding subunit